MLRHILVLLFFGGLSWAADPQDWSRVTALTPGQRVEVVYANLKTARGALASATTDELRLSGGNNSTTPQVIRRSEVLRISLRENSKRLRNVLLGAAIGAAGGLIAGAAKDSSYSEDGEHLAKMIFTPAGAAIGAGVGAGFPAFQTIYRAPATQPKTPPVP